MKICWQVEHTDWFFSKSLVSLSWRAWPWHSESSSCEVGQIWSRLVYSSTLSRCSVAAAMTTCSANIFPIQLNARLSLPARHSLKKREKKKVCVISFTSFVPLMLVKQAVVHSPPCHYQVSWGMSMLLQAVSQTLRGHVWTWISVESSLDRLHSAILGPMAAVRCAVDFCFAVAVVSPFALMKCVELTNCSSIFARCFSNQSIS